jgi:DNA-binding NarL/FixJ family response regulator
MQRIAIVEDKPFLLETLAQQIGAEAGMKVCLLAHDGQDFLDKIHALPTEALPTIVLMDINMPRLDGIQATRQIKTTLPNLPIIMLTVFDEDAYIFEAILAGANGYLLKDEPIVRIIQALQDVENGGAQMSPEIALKALNFLRNATPVGKVNKPTPKQNLLVEEPTKRELEVLQAIAQGLSYQETANALFISLDTVRTHLRKVYQKLYAKNKIEAIATAQKRGWF